jgi:DinB superfamily
MDARQIFLERHVRTHSSAMNNEGGFRKEDTVFEDLTEQEFRIPPNSQHNSIAWLVWHIARCEDVAVNTVLRRTEEVLDRDSWLGQLGTNSRHIGTGASREEMEAISRHLDLDALRMYRAAVGRETRAWASTLDFNTLTEVVSAADAKCAVEKGDIGDNAGWVETKWASRDSTRISFLFWIAIEHNWYHFGEITVIRGLLGHPGG